MPRMNRPPKGQPPKSVLRDPSGNSLLAGAIPEPSGTTADAAQATLTWDVQEDARMAGLVLATPSANEWTVEEVRHKGANLITGVVPADLFAADSIHNPRVDRFVGTDDLLRVKATNESGAAEEVYAAYATHAVHAGEGYPGPAFKGDRLRGGRHLIAWGCDADHDIAAGASADFELELDEKGVADKLVVGPRTQLANLIVTAITVDNDPLEFDPVPAAMFACDSVLNPSLGHLLGPGHKVSITIKNRHAATARDGIAVCITAR